MEYLATAWQFIGHLDGQLDLLLQHYGGWIYLILFLVIFCETGLVVAPFLPGDSLLFASGALWAAADMQVEILALTLVGAALCGRQLQLLDRTIVRKPNREHAACAFSEPARAGADAGVFMPAMAARQSFLRDLFPSCAPLRRLLQASGA